MLFTLVVLLMSHPIRDIQSVDILYFEEEGIGLSSWPGPVISIDTKGLLKQRQSFFNNLMNTHQVSKKKTSAFFQFVSKHISLDDGEIMADVDDRVFLKIKDRPPAFIGQHARYYCVRITTGTQTLLYLLEYQPRTGEFAKITKKLHRLAKKSRKTGSEGLPEDKDYIILLALHLDRQQE